VGEWFGFDEVLATRLELEDGRYTGRIVPPYCFGPDKIGYAEQACRARGADLSQAAYFGDSSSDIPLLEAVGFPTAVNPEGVLATRAADAGWRVVRWTLNED
jgi:putative phosphoserine phosphatase / 1-acylglycerol-3-phosphate O-acyltransferase